MNFIYAVIMVVTVMVSIKSVAAPLPAGQTFSIDDPATICATLSPVNGINVAKTCNDISVEQNNLDYTTYNGWSLYKSYTWFNYTSGTHQDGTTYPNGASWPVVASTGAVDFSKFLFKIETYPTSPPATTWRTTFNLDYMAEMLPQGGYDFCGSLWRQYTCFYMTNSAGTLVKPYNSNIFYKIGCTSVGNPI